MSSAEEQLLPQEEKIKQATVSVKLPPSLKTNLESICAIEGKSFHAVKHYLVQIALSIARDEKEFRLIPEDPQPEESVGESDKVTMAPNEKEALEAYAREEDLSVSELVCQFLWVGVEYHKKLNRPGAVLRKEEFRKRIQEDLQYRWRRKP